MRRLHELNSVTFNALILSSLAAACGGTDTDPGIPDTTQVDGPLPDQAGDGQVSVEDDPARSPWQPGAADPCEHPLTTG